MLNGSPNIFVPNSELHCNSLQSFVVVVSLFRRDVFFFFFALRRLRDIHIRAFPGVIFCLVFLCE